MLFYFIISYIFANMAESYAFLENVKQLKIK